jgi:hypothetical protein
MLGEFELAAGDRGMGDFHHGVCPPYVYRAYCTAPPATVNCGLRIADCGLAGRTAGSRTPYPDSRFPIPAVPQLPSHLFTEAPAFAPEGHAAL